VPLGMVRVMQGVPGLQVVTGPMYNVWDLRMNVARPPFDDLRVRQAVAGYGLDRHEILKLGFLGYGQPSVSMLTPGMEGYQSLLERYPYDPQKPRAWLQEPGLLPSGTLAPHLLYASSHP